MKILSALLPLFGMLDAVENQENAPILEPLLTRTVSYSALLRKGEIWNNPEKEFNYRAKVEMTDLSHPKIIIEEIHAKDLDLNSEIKPLINRNMALYIRQRSLLAEKFSLLLPGENAPTISQIDITGTNDGWRSVFNEKEFNQ